MPSISLQALEPCQRGSVPPLPRRHPDQVRLHTQTHLPGHLTSAPTTPLHSLPATKTLALGESKVGPTLPTHLPAHTPWAEPGWGEVILTPLDLESGCPP